MWSCVQLMMTVLRVNSAVQMGVVMCAKLECLLEFASLRGKSTALVKAFQLEMAATHGKLIVSFTCRSLCLCIDLSCLHVLIRHSHHFTNTAHALQITMWLAQKLLVVSAMTNLIILIDMENLFPQCLLPQLVLLTNLLSTALWIPVSLLSVQLIPMPSVCQTFVEAAMLGSLKMVKRSLIHVVSYARKHVLQRQAELQNLNSLRLSSQGSGVQSVWVSLSSQLYHSQSHLYQTVCTSL